MFSLGEKVALITGAASGLGLAIAQAYAEQSAKLVLVDINYERCKELAAEFNENGVDAIALGADLGDLSVAKSLVDSTVEAFGRIDVLVCCAGIEGYVGPLNDSTAEDWDKVLKVNLLSAQALSSYAIPEMIKVGGGSVIFMASISALRGNKNIGMYAVSKAGLIQLARNLAIEHGPDNIRVNSIVPGLIRTPLSAHFEKDKKFMDRRLGMTPLRRIGLPHEISGIAVMLAGKAGAFITGQTIVADGGTTVTDGS
jgi:NAD(P)-dependent dehydrogenase (short-subunit alcohol dehydrogenase family)